MQLWCASIGDDQDSEYDFQQEFTTERGALAWAVAQMLEYAEDCIDDDQIPVADAVIKAIEDDQLYEALRLLNGLVGFKEASIDKSEPCPEGPELKNLTAMTKRFAKSIENAKESQGTEEAA